MLHYHYASTASKKVILSGVFRSEAEEDEAKNRVQPDAILRFAELRFAPFCYAQDDVKLDFHKRTSMMLH